eukprot:GILI01018133.1.p1 GENE.GILI01018133.1~~GILI01018133.1.p1  ORF type:complete len:546 (+),score=49.67 GILI01018133.1:177-1814(+)
MKFSSATLFVVLVLVYTTRSVAESTTHTTRDKETTTESATSDGFSTTSSLTSTHTPTSPTHTFPTTAPANNSKKKKPVKGGSADAPIDVEDITWAWVPPVVLGSFIIFFLTTVKFKKLEYKSPREFLAQYVTVEGVYTSLGREFGSTHHEVIEQKKVEYGHQFFCCLGVVFLLTTKAFLASDNRYVTEILVYSQIALFICNIILDITLIKFGYLRPVRSINIKLRFAHCCYQTFLFCTEILGSADDDTSFQLPPDVFIWASIHYCYESLGEILEGLSVTGLSEVVIVVYVNATLIQSEYAPTGWALAFGLTSLSLSCFSIVVAMFWKVWAIRFDENHWDMKRHAHSEHEHEEDGHEHGSVRSSIAHHTRDEGNLHGSFGNDSVMTASMTTLVAAIIKERQQGASNRPTSNNLTRNESPRQSQAGHPPRHISNNSIVMNSSNNNSSHHDYLLNHPEDLSEELLPRAKDQGERRTSGGGAAHLCVNKPTPPQKCKAVKERPPLISISRPSVADTRSSTSHCSAPQPPARPPSDPASNEEPECIITTE